MKKEKNVNLTNMLKSVGLNSEQINDLLPTIATMLMTNGSSTVRPSKKCEQKKHSNLVKDNLKIKHEYEEIQISICTFEPFVFIGSGWSLSVVFDFMPQLQRTYNLPLPTDLVEAVYHAFYYGNYSLLDDMPFIKFFMDDFSNFPPSQEQALYGWYYSFYKNFNPLNYHFHG